MAGGATPETISQPCPSWCEREHAGAHADDLLHTGGGRFVDGVVGRWRSGEIQPEPVTLIVYLEQSLADKSLWLSLADAEGPLCLRLDMHTARSLVQALRVTLEVADLPISG